MQFEGAVLREQGVTFAIVVVKRHVVDNRTEAQSAIRSFSPVFPGVPVVLMAQDSSGRATYFGRPDITRFMSHVSPSRVPWKRYTLN
ncbi:MAG: hypothetical protein K2W86_16690 [Sphingomonas sp.]|jgi:hypothetical protein|uniref:Uncharacterized protein n=1 Tax=Sphingomonas rubra TaxID=634430 RepID=A0A1I5URY1_9SPHN|nr:hypothetical protein [Sphingomonas sp. TDK1]MBY0306777.1 hypothetical protein [Sphingomonas sp.]SFP97979.1 hypothetical protein SAMN04488241_11520 [Sphingomonas rubra]|tara:strand:- start:261 stop:521 length:261 start_codon:yes stop_codon:yes gene_type:complete